MGLFIYLHLKTIIYSGAAIFIFKIFDYNLQFRQTSQSIVIDLLPGPQPPDPQFSSKVHPSPSKELGFVEGGFCAELALYKITHHLGKYGAPESI